MLVRPLHEQRGREVAEAHRRLVLDETLVVARQRSEEHQALYALEAMYPFLALGPLTANINHVESHSAKVEEGLGGARRAGARVQYVDIVR